MKQAINKKTKELVSAFMVHQDGSYQNLNKGEWIAPQEEIINQEEREKKGLGEDVAVFWKPEKEYINFKGTYVLCCPHFCVYSDQEAQTQQKNPTHSLLEDWLFGRLIKDDLEFIYSKGTKAHKYDNKIKLSELDINWNNYNIEVAINGTRKLRADILLPFNKKNMLLGNGIVFEIQLSNQTEITTHERSIERALQGYSVVWLFKEDFIIEDDNIRLKENVIKINSFSEQMYYARTGFVGFLKNTVEEQCRFLDEKIKETNLALQQLEEKKDKIYWELIEKLKPREAQIINKINSLEDNPYKEIIEKYKKYLDGECEYNISKIQEKIEEMKRSHKPFSLGICPKCKMGTMHLKKTRTGKECYGCSAYSLNNCNNTIWIN